MKALLWIVSAVAIALGLAVPAGATIINVFDPDGSNLGGLAAIIPAPTDAGNNGAFGTAQQGFDERQGVVLPMDIVVDGLGIISLGTVVDSHMIFLNQEPGGPNVGIQHFKVEWTFGGEILGVMSQSRGEMEVATSAFLGVPGTLYPLAPFNARGMEGNDDGMGPAGDGTSGPDGYTILDPFRLRVGMGVTEPGDWIRVITRPQVPEPTTLALLGAGLLLAALSRARSEKS